MPLVPRYLRTPVILLVAGACALLALCGGLAPASAEAGCKYSRKNPDDIRGKEARQAISCLVNKKRNEHGRGDYSNDGRLASAADNHSEVMARKSCFSHQCSGEPSLAQRIRNSGYLSGARSWSYGENIAHGSGGNGEPYSIVKSWMNSSAHRAAILSGTFKEMGVGYEDRGKHGYYTVDFGFRRG